MATVTTPIRAEHSGPQRRVYHPLDRLRGYIRSYVSIEGLAVLLIYAALWFWIGLLVDYGFFKLFTLDWVQEVPARFPRTLFLGTLSIAIAILLKGAVVILAL